MNEKPTRSRNPQSNSAGVTNTNTFQRANRKRDFVEWEQLSDAAISGLVRAAAKDGRAVILGITSDGGAFSVTILDGDQRIREWPRSSEEFEDLAEWCQAGI